VSLPDFIGIRSVTLISYLPHLPSFSPEGEEAVLQIFDKQFNYRISLSSQLFITEKSNKLALWADGPALGGIGMRSGKYNKTVFAA